MRARHERAIVKSGEALIAAPGEEDLRTDIRAALNAAETTSSRAMSLTECGGEYMDIIDKRALGVKESMTTGFPSMDSVVGFTRKALVVIGARTSKGKSALLLKLAYLFSKRGLKVLFVSAEMTRTEFMDRLTAIKTGIELWRLRKDGGKERMSDVTAAVTELARLPIHIEEGGKFTMSRIAAAVETVRPDVVVVDYIQRFSLPNKQESRAAFFSDIANGLKSLAMEKNILVMAASQLNRELEHRIVKTPSLADLKESGGIEEAADVVILIHAADSGEFGVRMVDLIVAKNRNGACAKSRAS